MGGLCRMPMAMGGGPSKENSIYQSLKDGAGQGFINNDDGTLLNIENQVIACAISRAQAQNAAAVNNALPQLATWSIPLWEQHLGIAPPSGATIPQRRAVIFAKAQASGVPWRDVLNAVLRAALNDPFAHVVAGTTPQVQQRLTPIASIETILLGGGSLAAGQYAFAVTMVDQYGNEGFPSQPQVVTLSGANTAVTAALPTGINPRAASTNVYMSSSVNALTTLALVSNFVFTPTNGLYITNLPTGVAMNPPAPPAPSLTAFGAGGSLPAGNYAVSVAYVDSSGQSWFSSPASSIAITLGQSINVGPTSLLYGAVAVNYYFSTTTGQTSLLAYVGQNNGTSFNIGVLPTDPPLCSLHTMTAIITSVRPTDILLAKELLGPILSSWTTIDVLGGGVDSPFILGTTVPPASPLGTGLL
jgi:hypothetical protein